MIGVGPAPIEDVLAVGMALEIERHGTGDTPAFVANGQMLRLPTGFRAGGAAFLQGLEKGVADKGIVPRAGIPLIPGDVCDPGVDRDGYSITSVGQSCVLLS